MGIEIGEEGLVEIRGQGVAGMRGELRVQEVYRSGRTMAGPPRASCSGPVLFTSDPWILRRTWRRKGKYLPYLSVVFLRSRPLLLSSCMRR